MSDEEEKDYIYIDTRAMVRRGDIGSSGRGNHATIASVSTYARISYHSNK